MLFDGDMIKVKTSMFRVTFEYDADHGTPWENEDGHGDVTEWTTRDKRPGELVLNRDRHSARYYDFAGAVRKAKAEGWDTKPYGQGTKGERAARAAMADYDRLRKWCEDYWHYTGIIVELLDENEDGTGEIESLWGVESDAWDHHDEIAEDLALEILARLERRAA